MKLLVLLAALPLLAAMPRASRAELLFVDYDGVVTGSSGQYVSAYALGERVRGRLAIDTELAGPRLYGNSYYSAFGTDWGARDVSPDFVTGCNLPNQYGNGTDRASFALHAPDGNGGFYGAFSIADDTAWGRGYGIELSALGPQFLERMDFKQSIDLKASDVKSLLGTILEGTDQWVTLTLSRLSMKPGRCFAT